MRQKLIVYSLDGITEHIYCTAYTDEQIADGVLNCATWLIDRGLFNATSRPTVEDARTFYAYSY